MSDHFVNEDIVTYNPNYTKEHYDSSEFGDHGDDAPNDKLLIRPKVLNKFVAEKDVSNNKVTRSSKSQNVGENVTPSNTAIITPCHHCGCMVKCCPKTLKLDQEADECSQRTSKANVTKKLSNVFQCSSNRKTETTAEENDRNAINNKRVYCPECRQRQIRKFYRKQRYRASDIDAVMSPVQALQIQTAPDGATEPRYSKTNTVYAGEIRTRKRKVYKYTRDFDFDKKNKQDLHKYNTSMKLTNRSQQYSGYAVFNSQCCQRDKEGGTTSACCNMPPVPSFWEFMFNKLSAKYQEALNLATCDANCKTMRDPSSKGTPSQETSETQTDRLYSQMELGVATSQRNSESQTQTKEANSVRRTSTYDKLSPRPSQSTSPTTSKKMNTQMASKSSAPFNPKCKCPSQGCNKGTTHDKPVIKMAFPDNNKSCQLSHDGLTQALKDKYNGEVLCIHNPPCILINGCVNLPHQAPKPLDIWQITTARRKADPKKNHRLEICQLPSVELQCKNEKEEYNPNICNHKSPCEVVPVCYNSNYSADYVGSCEHDPVCNKVPVCLIETEQKITRFSCEHVPLSGDVPDNFQVLELDASAKVDHESMVSHGSTQVDQLLRLICHHKPPCIMIPKCLGQVMVVRRKGGAIPDCIHKPPCEYIPACGRNYVKMLAACSCSISPRPQCRIT